jgi:hypothetical protein
MTPSESATTFTAFSAARGVNLSSSTPREGLEQMLLFYQSAPATGCSGPDGDMLLFQWGTYDWGEGRHFELNITRQFIEQELQDDDAISQLSLTYKFEPTLEREAMKDCNRWCHELTELGSFQAFVLSSPAYLAAESATPVRVELIHSHV